MARARESETWWGSVAVVEGTARKCRERAARARKWHWNEHCVHVDAMSTRSEAKLPNATHVVRAATSTHRLDRPWTTRQFARRKTASSAGWQICSRTPPSPASPCLPPDTLQADACPSALSPRRGVSRGGAAPRGAAWRAKATPLSSSMSATTRPMSTRFRCCCCRCCCRCGGARPPSPPPRRRLHPPMATATASARVAPGRRPPRRATLHTSRTQRGTQACFFASAPQRTSGEHCSQRCTRGSATRDLLR